VTARLPTEIVYLSIQDLLIVASRVVADVQLRDAGGLESAAARPRATVFGADAYPSLHDNAAALVHSIARNHPLVDGNKRLALAGAIAFFGLNGRVLSLTNDEAYDLIMAVATGPLDDISEIASRLQTRQSATTHP
jgi:death-on-curing protein